MKLCKQHREDFRRSIEYAYHAGYDDGAKGEKKTNTLKSKEVRNIGTVLLLAFESVGFNGFSCGCDNTKSIDLMRRVKNMESKKNPNE